MHENDTHSFSWHTLIFMTHTHSLSSVPYADTCGMADMSTRDVYTSKETFTPQKRRTKRTYIHQQRPTQKKTNIHIDRPKRPTYFNTDQSSKPSHDIKEAYLRAVLISSIYTQSMAVCQKRPTYIKRVLHTSSIYTQSMAVCQKRPTYIKRVLHTSTESNKTWISVAPGMTRMS